MIRPILSATALALIPACTSDYGDIAETSVPSNGVPVDGFLEVEGGPADGALVCVEPSFEGSCAVTDEDGWFELRAPTDDRVAFRYVLGPDPILLQLAQVGDGLDASARLITLDELEAAQNQAGARWIPDSAHLYVEVWGPSGVALSLLGSDVGPSYVDTDGVVNLNQDLTALDGGAWFFDVPYGPGTLSFETADGRSCTPLTGWGLLPNGTTETLGEPQAINRIVLDCRG